MARPNQTMEGSPLELARWIHRSLQRRARGTLFAVVMFGNRRAELVTATSKKCKNTERLDPSCIAGYFKAANNMDNAGVTVDVIAEAIEETIR